MVLNQGIDRLAKEFLALGIEDGGI